MGCKIMKNFFIYIDDSGSPGQVSANSHLAPDTKIWAAVILCEEEKIFIDEIIKLALKKIQLEPPISEFHFTEIYSGKNEFKGVDPELRLNIFKLFVELYNNINPYVIITAAGEGTLKNSGFSESYINTKVDGFNFCNPGDYALNTLLLLIDGYFAENYKDDDISVEIFIDEGRQKANTIQKLNNFVGVCKELNYKSSTNEYGLQFIDFIAFYINRVQNNFSKSRSEFDNKFMRIVGCMQLNSNLKMISVYDVEELNKNHIESCLEDIEKASIESIKYIEDISKYTQKMCENFSEKKYYDNKEILQDIMEIKESHSDNMSDEFKIFLDIIEHLLSEES